MRTPTSIPYAGVICRLHGFIDIDEGNYTQQMRNPNARWKCPICKQDCEFDDNRYEELHPETFNET